LWCCCFFFFFFFFLWFFLWGCVFFWRSCTHIELPQIDPCVFLSPELDGLYLFPLGTKYGDFPLGDIASALFPPPYLQIPLLLPPRAVVLFWHLSATNFNDANSPLRRPGLFLPFQSRVFFLPYCGEVFPLLDSVKIHFSSMRLFPPLFFPRTPLSLALCIFSVFFSPAFSFLFLKTGLCCSLSFFSRQPPPPYATLLLKETRSLPAAPGVSLTQIFRSECLPPPLRQKNLSSADEQVLPVSNQLRTLQRP